ncbi:flagellin [Halomonas sp. 707B3]|uniref:flagellin N-terminal helical domain-containing protein n=1 Tax=Halomonas sp. 707B3 TaxID=1681043 RepID=UPI002646D513|nr:flagellin [Halomonas sp. 707B3]
MSVINTNITSMIGQQNLRESQNSLQTSMERLSSGLRINSAKDDAAGQAIANRMSSQITGLSQAQRNANDGISVAQTAEGGLNQINDNLQRIRELTVQSQNGTNSADDLQSIQDEITQRLSEIDRISAETNFNGTAVLAADRGLDIQVGANDGETISVNLQEVTASALGLGSFDATSTFRISDLETTATQTLESSSLNPKDAFFTDSSTAATNYDLYKDENGNLFAYDATANEGYAVTYDNATGELEFSSTSAAAMNATDASVFTQINDGDDVVVGSDAEGNDVVVAYDPASLDDSANPEPELYVDNGNSTTPANDFYVKDGESYYAATIDYDTGEVTYDSSVAGSTAGDLDGETLVTGAIVSNPEDAVTINVSGLDTAKVGDTDNVEVFAYNSESNQEGYVVKGSVDGKDVYYSATVNETDGTVELGKQLTDDPLKKLDAALNQVDSFRSELGAVQNRFESAITNLSTNETNLSAARSRIEDADYAVEVAEMTRAQILQQAGTSVLAQANQLPQNVLSLLG